MNTSVVHIKRKGGAVVQDCDIYVGRSCYQGGWKLEQSIWANPFSLKKCTREDSLKLYKEHIVNKIKENPTLYNLNSLKGKRLGCWCITTDMSVPIVCHAQILMQLANEMQ